MAYQSWSVVFGEQPSAAKWNILGTNDASFNDGTGIASLTIGATTAVRNSYKFSAYNSSATSLTQNNAAKVGLQTELFDTGSNFDSATNYRFTAPIAGFYFFAGEVGIASLPNAGVVQALLYKNGSLLNIGSSGQNATTISFNTYSNVSALVQLAANDYIELWATETAGGTQTTINASTSTYLMGYLVSST